MDTSPPRAYRVNDFCRAYSLGRTSTYKLIKSGALKSYVVAGRRLIPSDAAEKLFAGNDIAPAVGHRDRR
jgi:hypothetical protein